MNPNDIQNYGYVPLAGSNAMMLNSLNAAEGNPLAYDVQPSMQAAKIQRAANPFGANHMSAWGLDESHLGEKDANGNRIVNKAGMDLLKNQILTGQGMQIQDNSNVLGIGRSSQNQANSQQESIGESQSQSNPQKGLFGRTFQKVKTTALDDLTGGKYSKAKELQSNLQQQGLKTVKPVNDWMIKQLPGTQTTDNSTYTTY